MASYLSRAPHALRSPSHDELAESWAPGEVRELPADVAEYAASVWGGWIVQLPEPGKGAPVSSPVDRSIRAAPKTRKRTRKKRSS